MGKIHGKNIKSREIQGKLMEFQGISWKIQGNPGNSMEKSRGKSRGEFI